MAVVATSFSGPWQCPKCKRDYGVPTDLYVGCLHDDRTVYPHKPCPEGRPRFLTEAITAEHLGGSMSVDVPKPADISDDDWRMLMPFVDLQRENERLRKIADRLGAELRALVCANSDDGQTHLLPEKWERRIQSLVWEWERAGGSHAFVQGIDPDDCDRCGRMRDGGGTA